MGRFLFKLALFAALTAACKFGLDRLIIAAGQIYKSDLNTVCEQKRWAVRDGRVPREAGKTNVLFMGYSKILAGILPAKFDELNGGATCSWNLALPALPISSHYFELKDYLAVHPAPQVIILRFSADNGNPVFATYACEGATAEEALSYWVNRRDSDFAVHYFHPITLYRTCLYNLLSDCISNSQLLRSSQQHKADVISRLIDERGRFDFNPAGRLSEAAKAPYDPAVLSELPEDSLPIDADPYVKRFFDLARSSGIKVLLIEAPFRNVLYQRKAMPPQYAELLKRYDNVFIDRDEGWRIKFYDNSLFCDLEHLNREGAEKFTAQIQQEYMRVFGKP